MTTTNAARPWWDKITPRASVRVQMVAAATLWLIGLGFLLGFGISFIVKLVGMAHPAIPVLVLIVLAALALGIVKARYILIRYADKAVARIQRRDNKCFFGFFGWSSWAFILVMMGGGAILRLATPLPKSAPGLTFLAILYIGIGTGLAIADRIFWMSVFRSVAVHEPITAE